MRFLLECWGSVARPQRPYQVAKTKLGVEDPPDYCGPLPIAHPKAVLFATAEQAVEYGKRELPTCWVFWPVVRLDSGRVLLPPDDARTYRGEVEMKTLPEGRALC